jgi:hypothetical protein
LATFEQGFAEAERAAIALGKAAGAVVSAAKQIQKSAAEGDIARIRRMSERLTGLIDVTRQEAANARVAWPFTPEEEEAYLRSEYEQELLAAASTSGLQLQRRDENLVAFPSVVRIAPSERAVRVDRQRVVHLRPSRLVATLKANQIKKPRFASERFIETLFRAYRLLVGKDGTGTTIPLTAVHEALTLLPGSASDYDRGDFGRDLYLLDRSGIRTTRSGAVLSLPASTGTRGARNTFSFVAPDGTLETYYGIRFTASEP